MTYFIFFYAFRYHKLIWGPHGIKSDCSISGVIIAGGENGNVILYDPAKIMAGDDDVVIAQQDKHTGPVRALDVNPYQVRSLDIFFTTTGVKHLLILLHLFRLKEYHIEIPGFSAQMNNIHAIQPLCVMEYIVVTLSTVSDAVFCQQYVRLPICCQN